MFREVSADADRQWVRLIVSKSQAERMRRNISRAITGSWLTRVAPDGGWCDPEPPLVNADR